MNDMKDILSAFDNAGEKVPKRANDKSMKQLLETLDNINESVSMNVSMSGETPEDIKNMLSSFSDSSYSTNTQTNMSTTSAPVGPVDPVDNSYDCTPDQTLSSDDIVYKTEEEYNNEPSAEYQDTKDIVNRGSDDIHSKKKSYARAEPGDNPRAVKEARSKDSLKEQYSKEIKQRMKESFSTSKKKKSKK